MGMVMYIRAGAVADLDEMVDEDDALFEWATDESAWEADKMWWAALDLLFGPGGADQLQGDPITGMSGYTPIMRMQTTAVADLAASFEGIDALTVSNRFDAGSFGEALGPDVSPADRDWLSAATLRLAELIRETSSAGHDLVWVVT